MLETTNAGLESGFTLEAPAPCSLLRHFRVDVGRGFQLFTWA